MDCREFHESHLAFVDDTIAGVELVRMQMHLNECDACSRHDATIRRSLMLFRNLPRIEPSADFSKKLEMKLREVKLAEAAQNHRSNFGFKAGVTIASAVMLAYIGISLRQVDTPQDIILPPVVATAITSEISTGGPAPEMIAAAPAGIPIWTAALFAEQTPSHFASIQLVSSTR